jgi:hypothetical protein
MIQQHGYIVTFMYIFAHSSILRRKRRGIYPKEIKFEAKFSKIRFENFASLSSLCSQNFYFFRGWQKEVF